MSSQEKKKEGITDSKYMNLHKLNLNENYRNSNNIIFSTSKLDNKFSNSQNNYKKTNISLIQNEPILNSDNFQDIFNKFKIFESKNNNNFLSTNYKNNEIASLKISLKFQNRNSNKSTYNYNESQDSKDINSSIKEKIELLKDFRGSNKEKKIEIINIQKNFPEENSFNNNSNLINNTIKTFDNEDEDNMNSYYQNANNIFIDNKENKNATLLDLDNFSENNFNNPEINISKNANESKNSDIFVTFNKNNQNDFLKPFPSLQNISSSPYKISSFDSKKDIIYSSNTNKNKYNFIPSMNTEISPIIKMLNNRDSNEIKIKNNFNNINININNTGSDLSIFSKNPFDQLNPFIQKKEQ